MNWKAIGHGVLFGFKVAGQLVSLGVIHGKPEKVVETGQKIIQAIEDAKKPTSQPEPEEG